MRLLIATLMACLSLSALGQAPRPALTPDQVASIDTFVTQEMRHEQIPGVAIGVNSRGRILLAKAYGLANIELNVPVKPETIFQSGSVGKQFVSAAIMMLVEEGKLSIDDSVTKYFPDAPATWKPILLKNLFSHTSSSPNTKARSIPSPADLQHATRLHRRRVS
jgi:CubicO group peptidase (beta-lactamase class C family)